MFGRWFGRKSEARHGRDARCLACPLAHCARGARATVLRVGCESAEACRLRELGLHEGALVTVLDAQDGLLLEVRGARLALGAALAAAITVLPRAV